MTTEVLRNMLLTESHQLMTLGLVVLDEVHYLQDPFRGGVWEEVLILTPPPCASSPFRRPLETLPSSGVVRASARPHDSVIVELTRPIKLHDHLAVVRRGQPAAEVVDLLDGQRLSDEAPPHRQPDEGDAQVSTRTEMEGAQVERAAAAVSRPSSQ